MNRRACSIVTALLLLGTAHAAVAQSVPAAFLLYPNYRGLIFDDRPEIVVDAPAGAAVVVADSVSGATVATASSSGKPVSISATSFAQNHPYTVTVLSGGATIASWAVSAVPASSRGAMNVSFDPAGRLLLKGRPRFGLGVYDNGFGYSNDPSFYETTIFAPGGARQLDGINLNLYLNYHFGQATLGPMQVLMDVLQKHGMMYLQTGNCFSSGSYTRIPFSIDQSDAYPTQLGQHAGSAGYYIMDECKDALIPETKTHHARLAGLDPASMTFAVTYANGFDGNDNRKWVEAADVLGTDPYPLYGAEPSQGYSHFQVADSIANLANAQRFTRPVFGVLQFFKFTSDSRWPTYAEKRTHAVMSIVEGAQGLFWWEIGNNGLGKADPATRAAQMSDLRSIVNELAALEPALTSPDVPSALTANSTRYADPIAGRKTQLALSIANSWLWSAKRWYQAELDRLNAGDTSQSPLARDAADIRTRVKVVGGRGYVFAYNYTNKTLPVTFSWHQTPGSVTENRSGASYPVSGNSWSDSFGPYESRIYVIGNGGAAPGADPTPTPTSAVTLRFTNPASGTTVTGATTVSLAATGGTGSGYSYKVSVDGAQVYAGTNPSFSWNTAAGANGTKAITATATDSAGASGTASISVNVSNGTVTPPSSPASFTVSFSNPTADGTSVTGNLSVGLKTSAPWGKSKTWTLSVDGRTLVTATNTDTVLWYTLDTRTLTAGSHTLAAAVSYGGATAGANRTISVASSGSAPTAAALTASITSPAAGDTLSGVQTVGMSSAGGASGSRTFKVEQIVGTTATLVSSQAVTGTTASASWDTTKAANGPVTVRVTVTDAGGASVSTTRSVTVSNATFSASVTSPTEGSRVIGTLSIGASTSAPWGASKTFSVVLDGKVISTTTSTTTVQWVYVDSRTLANGGHTVKVGVSYNGQTAWSSVRTFTVGN